jgi:hypothetical protein
MPSSKDQGREEKTKQKTTKRGLLKLITIGFLVYRPQGSWLSRISKNL